MDPNKSALISTFVVGGGQMYSRRFLTGVSFAIIFYGSIALMINLWTGINVAFWCLLAAWILVWLFNIYDAYKGIKYEKSPCEKACPAGAVLLNDFPSFNYSKCIYCFCCHENCPESAIMLKENILFKIFKAIGN